LGFWILGFVLSLFYFIFGFEFLGSGCAIRVWGTGFRVLGYRFVIMFYAFRILVLSVRSEALDFGFSGFGFHVSGFRHGGSVLDLYFRVKSFLFSLNSANLWVDSTSI